MSGNTFILRMGGILPPTDQISHLLQLDPTRAVQRGTVRHNMLVEKDYWEHQFPSWKGLEAIGDDVPDEIVTSVGEKLTALAEILPTFNTASSWVQFRIESVRDNAHGLLMIPAALLKAIALCAIDFHISVTVKTSDPISDEEG